MSFQTLYKSSFESKQILNEEFRRMQKLAGIITEAVDKALETKVGLLLKDPNIKTSIDDLIKNMPAEPKGSTMTKIPDDKMHITLTSIKSSKPFKDKLKDFQLPEDIKFPNVELGNAGFVYREDGKTTYVAAVKNQNDIKEFVDKIYQKIGETNPEPNRFFHITLANNQGGDPFKSIGNVEKSDLIKENKSSSLHFFFDLDGVLADMEKGLQQNPEILSLRKILDDLINNNFPEYKNLVDDKIKEKIKANLPPDAPANHPLRPLKKAFNNYTNKIFSLASKEGFYKNLSLMPGAKEMLKKAQEISGKKPDILSSPVQGENTSVQEKKDWVNANFGDLVDKIIIDTNKDKYAKSKNDILIDDRPKYVDAFESAGGSAILHKNYNDTIKEMEKFKQYLTENKMKKQILNEEFCRMQLLAGVITEGQYKQKLLNELQYFHNGAEMNQIINYDDSDITDDLEFLGQGSMNGQDFTPGSIYNIGGQEYKIEAQGDEFKLVLAEVLNEAVEVPTWLKGKLEDVHTKPGQGSIFSKSIDSVLKLAQDTLDKSKDIDKIANSTGTLTVKSPGIGYNLVLPIEQAKKLPGAKESEVEKIEGPNKIKVPAITTTAPLTQFKSDELTVIVRPKKDESGTVIPNEYIVLSAFPGDPSIPRASEWNGKYAVIIPGGKEVTESIEKTVNEVLKRYRKMLKEDNFNTLDNYFSGRDLKQYTGVTSFETCDEDDWDKVKDYVEKDKKNFLEQHPEITEQEFDKYMENWIDNIEDARGYESRYQQDMNYGY